MADMTMRTRLIRWSAAGCVQVIICCVVHMSKPAAHKISAAEWVSAPGIAAALGSISTFTEVSKTVLEAAQPAGGLTAAHISVLSEFAASAAAQSGSNKGLIFANLLKAMEANVFDGMPSLATHDNLDTKKIAERVKRYVTKYKGDVGNRVEKSSLSGATERHPRLPHRAAQFASTWNAPGGAP